MEPQSDYHVELNGASSDKIVVDGKGTVLSSRFEISRFETDDSPVLPRTTYTIMTTGGGLTVKSPEVAVADFPFISFTLSEDGYNGYLSTARSAERFAELATTPNEIAVANALDAAAWSPPGSRLWPAHRQRMQAGSPASPNASIHGAARSPLRPVALPARCPDRPDARGDRRPSPAVDGVTTVPTPERPVRSRAEALGSWGSADGDGNTADLSSSIGGPTSPASTSRSTTPGGSASPAASQTSFSSDDIAASGSGDSYLPRALWRLAQCGGLRAARRRRLFLERCRHRRGRFRRSLFRRRRGQLQRADGPDLRRGRLVAYGAASFEALRQSGLCACRGRCQRGRHARRCGARPGSIPPTRRSACVPKPRGEQCEGARHARLAMPSATSRPRRRSVSIRHRVSRLPACRLPPTRW